MLGLGLLLAVAFSAVAWLRITVHFSAAFDTAGAPGGNPPPLVAEVGTISNTAPPSEFTVVPDPSGGGQLSVSDTGTGAQAAVLRCEFEKPFKGQDLSVSWEFRQSILGGPVVVRLADDVDTGMIDVEYDGGGHVLVAGVPVGNVTIGVDYDFVLQLKDPIAGPASWLLTAQADAPGDSGSGGWTVAGPLAKGLVAASILLVRPAASPAASYRFDEIRAETYAPTLKN